MKKLSLYVFLVLMFYNVEFAQCIEGDCKNGYGTFTQASGAEYVGEWKKNEMHEQGTYTWQGGDKYVGEFKDSEYHGQGTLIYADGRIDNGIVQKKEKNEKIVIKRENTTNPNVKEKIKKDEEKKR